jgi:hypothetical protein
VFILDNYNLFDATNLFDSVTLVIIVYLIFDDLLLSSFMNFSCILALTTEYAAADTAAISVRAFPNDNAENEE